MLNWLKNKFNKTEPLTEGPPRPRPVPVGRKTTKKNATQKKKKVPANKKRKKSFKQALKVKLQKDLKGENNLLIGHKRDANGELVAVLSKPYHEMSENEKQIVSMQAMLAILDGSIKKAKPLVLQQ